VVIFLKTRGGRGNGLIAKNWGSGGQEYTGEVTDEKKKTGKRGVITRGEALRTDQP